MNDNYIPPKTGFFVGIKFDSGSKAYFFHTEDGNLQLEDAVVVETIRGLELGHVAVLPQEISQYNTGLELKPIVRKAEPFDVANYKENLEKAKESLLMCQKEAQSLGLAMNLISCDFTLDRSKVIFSYLADERVDFRDLLKILASRLHTRIELRQIGTRDKAKIIGGIGICGLPLCCSTFLSEFDGISISRAKNQLLALNIPKLSGHCGKLICCLKYEDEAYSDLRKDFPKVGTRFKYNDMMYRVASMNVLTRVIKIEAPGDVQFIQLDELRKIINQNPPTE
ncbi:MAG: stage 0 sporulation protein [Methanomicrobia archaeon]|nr:stage 0 sporulation protein [Methanomicrobia archaeon]